MAENHGEFADLMRRAQDGSEDAARELLARYGEHVLRVVRRRLDKALRSKFDSTDLAQDVWASFFAGTLGQQTFRTPDELGRFLAQMAYRKSVDAFRRWCQTAKYDLQREHALDSATVYHAVHEVAAATPSPSRVLAGQEEWESVLGRHTSRDQRILVLLRQGHTYQEIAAELGVTQRTIRRVVLRMARNARS